MARWCCPVHIHGWGWAGSWRSRAELGGLCSADNCHALYCTRPLSLPGPYAFQGISPSSQGPSPAWASLLQGSPRGTGPPPSLSPVPQGLEEAPSGSG